MPGDRLSLHASSRLGIRVTRSSSERAIVRRMGPSSSSMSAWTAASDRGETRTGGARSPLRTIAMPGLPRWPPADPAGGYIPAGGNDLGRRTPEPCAQVRILLGALLSVYFSNKTSADGRPGGKPLTCANADVINSPCPAGARDGVSGAQTCRPAPYSDNGCQAVAVTADRCSPPYPQLYSGITGTARARLSLRRFGAKPLFVAVSALRGASRPPGGSSPRRGRLCQRELADWPGRTYV
jgi:hypothetical protein